MRQTPSLFLTPQLGRQLPGSYMLEPHLSPQSLFPRPCLQLLRSSATIPACDRDHSSDPIHLTGKQDPLENNMISRHSERLLRSRSTCLIKHTELSRMQKHSYLFAEIRTCRFPNWLTFSHYPSRKTPHRHTVCICYKHLVQ